MKDRSIFLLNAYSVFIPFLLTIHKMKVIDCFTFFNELNMLELRLEELHKTVDLFVLVEATKTHAGKQKE